MDRLVGGKTCRKDRYLSAIPMIVGMLNAISLNACSADAGTTETKLYPIVFAGPSVFLRWTGDGQELVFATASANQFGPGSKGAGVRVYDTRSKETRILHEAPLGYTGLAITGQVAIFAEQVASGKVTIRQAPLLGGMVETLTPELDPSFTFAVTHDGERVLFSSDGLLESVAVGTAPAVVGRGFPFVVSPNGQQVVVAPAEPWFTDRFEILTMETGTTEPLQWTTGECNVLIREWRWTTDSLFVLLQGCADVLRHDPRTGTTTPLLATAGVDVDATSEGWSFGQDYDLSRDGRFLHFWKNRCSRMRNGTLSESCVENPLSCLEPPSKRERCAGLSRIFRVRPPVEAAAAG